MTREIVLRGGVLRYELIRKRVKRVNLRVRADGSVTVSAPPCVPLALIEEFLRQKEDFLMKAIQKTAEQKPADQPCADGGKVRFWGAELTLRFEKGGKYGATWEGEALCLRLREPKNAAAREAALSRWKKDCCAEMVESLLDQWHPRMQPFGVPHPTLRFREMTSRWGSCIPNKRVVTLNTRLLDYPQACMEYILVHELCHFLQADHSPKFYVWMDRFLPDWRERKRLLNGRG